MSVLGRSLSFLVCVFVLFILDFMEGEIFFLLDDLQTCLIACVLGVLGLFILCKEVLMNRVMIFLESGGAFLALCLCFLLVFVFL